MSRGAFLKRRSKVSIFLNAAANLVFILGCQLLLLTFSSKRAMNSQPSIHLFHLLLIRMYPYTQLTNGYDHKTGIRLFTLWNW